MAIEFCVGDKWKSEKARILYNSDEYSFDVYPAIDGYSPLVINNVNIMLNESGLVLGVWGFCPHTSWQKTEIKPPHSEKRDLFVKDDELVGSGIAHRINETEWKVYFNEVDSYVCIGIPEASGNAIEFTNGAILVLSPEGEVISLWIHLSA